MDKLRAMKFFCRVSESGSFAAAAQTFDVVPSAMSKVITGLEQELGFHLVNRSTRGLSLTDEGAVYYEQCRQILQDIEEAEGMGRNGQASARGTLRVGMHPALRFPVMTRLGGFLDQHPGIKLETAITNSPSAIVNEGMDVVLHIGSLADSSWRARPLGWTRSVVCASPAYLAAWGEPRHPEELSGHRAIIYARRDEVPNTRWTFSKDGESCEVDVPVRIVSRDGVGLIEAALGACGVARPFDLAVRHWLETGQLVELLRDWSAERQPVTAVLPAQGRSTSKTRVFLDWVEGLMP